MTEDDEQLEDDELAEETADDPVAASLRRARETLERTAMTPEQEAEHEERCRRNRLAEGDARIAEFLAGQQRPYEQRRAPIAETESRQEANRLYRVVEAPRKEARPPIMSEAMKQVIGKVVAELQKRSADALERAIGKLHGELLKRHDNTEQRTTGIEARIAGIEQRIAALEAKGVPEPEKRA